MPRQSTAPRTSPPAWFPHPGGCPRLTGARPSPAHRLASAPAFRPVSAPPAQFGVVPARLSMWGNNQYGDCVSAEEAYAKACHSPEIFIDDQTVIGWARQGGFLDGADLSEVLDAMRSAGFKVGNQLYNDGPKQSVDFSNIDVLRAAITEGNVKIAMDSSTLPEGAGNEQGWYAFGNKGGRGSDHCTGLSGYGTAAYCFGLIGVPVPPGVDPNKPDCFLHFTWSTVGVVDHAWLLGTCTEAWVRNPTTVGVPPLPDPKLDPDLWA